MQRQPRVLIVYFSRSGATRKVSEMIAEELDCDIEELRESDTRWAVWVPAVRFRGDIWDSPRAAPNAPRSVCIRPRRPGNPHLERQRLKSRPHIR